MNTSNTTIGLSTKLAFEAYAQMGSKLHLCTNHAEVNNLFKRHLKYLFNFDCVRIAYAHRSQYIIHEVDNGKADIFIGDKELLNHFEKEVSQKKRPLEQAEGKVIDVVSKQGWYFEDKNHNTLVLSFYNKAAKRVVPTQTVLKLLAESLIAKFLQFDLYNTLDKQKDEISIALATVTNQHKEIKKLAEEQQLEIDRKTQNIRNKNIQLQKIAKLNAHEVREPLTRILGLTKLLRLNQVLAHYQELEHIEQASKELDQVLKDTIIKVETELKS